MSLFGVEDLYSHNSASIEEDFLIRKILLTHNPDGSQLDSHLLLRAMENTIAHATPIFTISDPKNYVANICNAESNRPQGSLLVKISNEIVHRCHEEGDMHTNVMFLFEMLGNFRWDEKLVLVLAAFIMNYGEFQLTVQHQSHNPLAALLSVLRKVPCDLILFRKQFKALMVLVKTMLELTKVIIELESLPLQHELLEFKAISIVKSKIYRASYWIFRSSYACFSLLTGLRTRKSDQVDPNSMTIVAWTLSSLFYRLNSLYYELREEVDPCHQQIATGLYEKLLNHFKLSHIGNEESLQMLIPFNDNFPLKDCLSKEKHSVSELRNKVVIFLVSKPELLPVERIFWLVQQTHTHPQQEKIKGRYVILWFPISSSHSWSQTDEMNFHILSNSLPFWTLRQPWLLNSAVINFIIQEWKFNEQAMMVVLDVNGMLTSSNAMDMIWIWGAKAFPFSISREKELWEMQDSTLQLILDNVDSLLTSWIDQTKNLCIYASDNLEWIRNFCTEMKEMKERGLQLEVIYVGWQNPSQKLQKILDVIKQENLSSFLSFTKICFFWLRLLSMKNSFVRHNHEVGCDHILEEVTAMLEPENTDDGWVMIGTGPSADMEKLQGSKLTKFFDLFPVWAENVETLGLVGAIRNAFQPPPSVKPCARSEIIPYEGPIKETVICKECKRPRKKFVVYKCEETKLKVVDSPIPPTSGA